MNQKSKKMYCGIDISAATIDVCFQTDDNLFVHEKLSNDKIGFTQLIKLTGEQYHFVMECTGNYHLPLCFFLHDKKLIYSVVNALQIKRYIQMHLERNKTDKKDAMHICSYGIDRNPEPYEMPDSTYFECKALNNSIETITQEITSFKNKIFSIKKSGVSIKTIILTYQRIIKTLQLELKKLEQELSQKLQAWQPKTLALVSSVVGIGKRASSLLVVQTQGFKTTETYQQLISFAGLSPKLYSSGTSIKSKVRICKQGGGRLRHTLYMCALNAKSTNPQCKALFDRLVANGKNKKLALIAVCNKLLKLVFGVVNWRSVRQKLFTKMYLIYLGFCTVRVGGRFVVQRLF